MISFGQKRRIASNYLLSRGEFIRNPVVEIDESGRITSVDFCESPDRLPSTEFYSGVMFAGMVNAHSHLELSYLRGRITEGGGFSSFAAQMAQQRDLFSREDQVRAAIAADVEMQNQGVVAVGDISNCDVSFEAKRGSALHYHTFIEHFGLKRDSVSYLDQYLGFERSSLTQHSTYSVKDKHFKEIANRGEAPLSIHFMESEAERELFEQRGTMWEWYQRVGFECDFLHYGSPAKRIVNSIPKDRSVMLIHNVAVNQEDINVIMDYFTAPVYWVLCPRSNEFISSLTPPVELLMRNGLNICVGTDSLASNYSLSMLDEVQALTRLGAPLSKSLTWATEVGAKALQISDLGEVRVGCRAKINVLTGLDYSTMSLTPRSRVDVVVR